jgi:hypothetical protein
MTTKERKQRRREIKAQHGLDELAMLKDIRQSRRQQARSDESAKHAAMAEQDKRASAVSAQTKAQAGREKYGKPGKPAPVVVADLDTGEIRTKTTEKNLLEPLRRERTQRETMRRNEQYAKDYAKRSRDPRTMLEGQEKLRRDYDSLRSLPEGVREQILRFRERHAKPIIGS